MSKHLNPLKKEFLIRQYKSNYRIKCVTSAKQNHISTGSFQKWIKQYDEGGLKVWLVQIARSKISSRRELTERRNPTKREILKLRIENERLKKLCRADDGYWGTGVHSFKAEEFEIVELLSRDYMRFRNCALSWASVGPAITSGGNGQEYAGSEA